MNIKNFSIRVVPSLLATVVSAQAFASDWSDTAISVRTGSRFQEPFNPTAIHKNIFALTHASGYQYGSNFFNVDFLQSDKNDPASLTQSSGAQEAYVVYRHTLDLGKLTSTDLHSESLRGFGITAGFDWNTKNDVGYNSRKRMLVIGPTLMWNVPGFLNTSLLLLDESNAPSGAFPPISLVRERYRYKTHPMLNMSWGINLTDQISFEGYANFIATKGKSEVGQTTGAETNIDMQIMWDLSELFGSKKKSVKLGIEYQYWNNKFGNTATTTGGKGYKANTPMVRAEYHF